MVDVWNHIFRITMFGMANIKMHRLEFYFYNFLATGEGWDPSFEDSPFADEVMELGLNGLEAIPMVTKIRSSRPLHGTFTLIDDGIRDREAAGMITPWRRHQRA